MRESLWHNTYARHFSRFWTRAAGPCLVFAGLLGAALDNKLAVTPMGFSDWNAFCCDTSASLLEQTAPAMRTNGMQAAG